MMMQMIDGRCIRIEDQPGEIIRELFRSSYSAQAEQEFRRYERYAEANLPVYQDGAFWLVSSIRIDSSTCQPDNQVVVNGVAVYDDDATKKAWLLAAAKIEFPDEERTVNDEWHHP